MKNKISTEVKKCSRQQLRALSHEGGLIAPFTGSSPALGSIIVRIDDGTYIGKIDAVLGSTDSPIAHIAHLDRKMNPNDFIGCEAQIRPKVAKQDNRENNRGNRHAENRPRQSYNRDRADRSHRDNQSRPNRQDNRSRDNQSRPNWRDNPVTIEEIEETIAVNLTVVTPTVAMAEDETLGSVIQEVAEARTKSSLIMIGYAKSVVM